MLLGADDHHRILTGLAALEDPVTVLQTLFAAQARCVPYLRGYIEVLTSVLTRSDPTLTVCVVRGMLATLAEADLLQLTGPEHVAGDMLGPPCQLDHLEGSQIGTCGAFYTPPSVGALLAGLVEVRPGDSFADPCCGTGGLAIATIRAMRAAGRSPELVHWHLQDIDPVAVALAGVQLSSHGMPRVTLKCGNALLA